MSIGLPNGHDHKSPMDILCHIFISGRRIQIFKKSANTLQNACLISFWLVALLTINFKWTAIPQGDLLPPQSDIIPFSLPNLGGGIDHSAGCVSNWFASSNKIDKSRLFWEM